MQVSLHRTAAMRIALRYLALYVGVLALVAAAVGLWAWLAVDADLEDELAAQIERAAAIYELAGAAALATEMRAQEASADADEPVYWLLANAAGLRLEGNLAGWPQDTDISPGAAVASLWVDEEYLPPGLFDDDARLPAAARQFADGARLLILRGVDQAAGLVAVAEFLAEGLIAAIVLALAIAISLSRSLLKRMEEMDRIAGEIMAGDLSRRMPVSERSDEFDLLAARLNEMLERIQQLVRGIREVTDNIAHDLRGPLTRMRNRLEVAGLGENSPQEYAEVLQQSIDDADGLIQTFNALLSIAQAEAGNHRCEWGPVPLDELAADLAELYAGVAEERGQTLSLRSVPARVHGSRDLLAQALGNLLENAVKYTPAGGTIEVEVQCDAEQVQLSIRDSGPGIPAAEHDHVLQRFVRLEAARQSPGNGLGLSLVKAVTELHKGRLLLADAGPGLLVTIELPLIR